MQVPCVQSKWKEKVIAHYNYQVSLTSCITPQTKPAPKKCSAVLGDVCQAPTTVQEGTLECICFKHVGMILGMISSMFECTKW